MVQRPFISFDECKAKIPIPDVLHKFGIVDRFSNRNGVLVGCCPFPDHIHGPSPNSEQFRINEVDGVSLFRCWGDCKTAGNVVQFVMRMTGLSAEHVRFWFAENFGDRLSTSRSGEANESRNGSTAKKEAGEVRQKPQPAEQMLTQTKVPNGNCEYKQIRFRLNLDSSAKYLHDRGVSIETATDFGIGLATKGMMAGYIAIPIWDFPKGEFPIGYIGRWPGEDFNAEEGRPRYKVPSNFPKQRCIFGINEALAGQDESPLIVVEGVFGALRCIQCGFKSTVALLGSSLCDEQARLLAGTGRPIVLMLDGDDSGRVGMEAAAPKLLPKTFVRFGVLEDGKQPDDLTADELHRVLSFAL